MKVLFISYDGMTDPLGQSQVIPYLSSLTKYGHTFTILSCDKPDRFKQNEVKIRSILKDYPISWVSIPYTKKPPVLSTVKDLTKLKSIAAQLMKQEKFDMVHSRSGIGQLVALHMKKKFGVKFLNDIRGFWADERADGGQWNMRNPLFKFIYKYFKQKEFEAVSLADYNVCLTHRGKAEMLSWKNVKQPLKVDVVPCSVDLSLFNSNNLIVEKQEALRTELGFADGDFVFSYLGSLGGWYLTDEMLRFCKRAYQKMPNAKFLFISNDGDAEIRKLSQKYGIPDAAVKVRFGQREEVPLLLSLSKFSFFFIKPCYSKISSSPTKHGEIMALGIPVITNSGVGDVKEIVEKYNGGFVVNEMTDEIFDETLDKIISGGEVFDTSLIRQGAEEYYDLSKTVEVYKNVYNAISASKY